jgi:hypothetical protein
MTTARWWLVQTRNMWAHPPTLWPRRADLVADLKRLRLYGMAACYAEGLEQGLPIMTTATAGLA